MDDKYLDPMMHPRLHIKDLGSDYVIMSIISALSFEPRVYTFVDQKFRIKSAKYTRALLEHPYYEGMVQSMCPVSQIECAQKIFGMFLVDRMQIIDEMMQKFWSKIWRALILMETDHTRGLKKLVDNIVDYRSELAVYSSLAYYAYTREKEDWGIPDDYGDPQEYAPLFVVKQQLQRIMPKKQINEDINKLFSDLDVEMRDRLDGHCLIDPMCDDFGEWFDAADKVLGMQGIGLPQLFYRKLTGQEAENIAIAVFSSIFEYGEGELPNPDYLPLLFFGYLLTCMGKEYDDVKKRYFALKKEKNKKDLHEKLKEAQKAAKTAAAEIEKANKKITELENQLTKATAENRKISQSHAKETADAVKAQEKEFTIERNDLEDRIRMLEAMLSDIQAENETFSKSGTELSLDEMISAIAAVPDLVYVCNNETGAATKKLKKFKEWLPDLKVIYKENVSVPQKMTFIFYDFNLISHGLYYKVKNVAKRTGTPTYNIQDINPEKNIAEMYAALCKNNLI